MRELDTNTEKPTPEFNDWFIGFVEGDGTFSVRKRGDLDFVVYQKEKAILEEIQQVYQFGSISRNRTTGVYRLTTSNERDLRKIIHLFNGNIRMKQRYQQFERFVSGFNKRYTKPISFIANRKEICLEDAWFSGFIDAEGCFWVFLNKKNKKFNFEFSIGQKSDDEFGAKLEELFGYNSSCRTLYYKQKDFYEFRMRSLKGAFLIFPYLKAFPLKTQKRYSFSRWQVVHQKLLSKDHLDPQKRAKLVLEVNEINNFPEPK